MAPVYLSLLGNKDMYLVKDSASNAVLGKIVKKDNLPPAEQDRDYWDIYTINSAGNFDYLGYREFDLCAEIVYKVAKHKGVA